MDTTQEQQVILAGLKILEEKLDALAKTLKRAEAFSIDKGSDTFVSFEPEYLCLEPKNLCQV